MKIFRNIPLISAFIAAALIRAILYAGAAYADGYPPYWDNTNGAVHFKVLPWPTEAQFAANGYTRQGDPIKDPRSADGSNGGRAPQNYANVSSSCTSSTPDKVNPSVSWVFDKTTDPSNPTLFFRWRVEQIPNNYATGPTTQPYQAISPYFAAQWTVILDIDGDGYREFAVNIDGNSGDPSHSVDVIKSIYSNTMNQSLDYLNDPSVYYLFHQPTAFVYNKSGDPYHDYILNFRNSFNPTPVWPNGSAETVWDYGSTRVMNVSTDTCNEFVVDYQIPLKMLDATSVGGPKVTEYTPMCLAFVTANSNQDPLQKDVALDAVKTFTSESGVPCGDIITPAGGTFLQPVITSVASTGCGPTTFTTRIMAPLSADGLSILATGANAPTFYLYRDINGNGIADDAGQSWTSIGQATVSAADPALWSLSYNTSSLNRGQYLVGVKATNTDTLGNPWKVTWSFLTQAEVDSSTPPSTAGQYANPSPSPGVVIDTFYNSCGEYAALTKTVSPSYQAASQNVTFTVTVQNNTTAAFNLTNITDTLPSGFNYRSAPAEGGTLAASIETRPADLATNLTWTFVGGTSIPAMSSRTLTFTARVSSTVGTYSNTASAVNNDPDWGALISNPVDIGVGSPRLTISKQASSYSVNANDVVTYTITYSNDSPVDTTGVVLTDTMPSGMTFLSASGGGTYDAGTRIITWSLPNLASLEGPYSVTVTARVEKTASTRTTNTATITSAQTSAATASATIFVNTPMKIQKSADVSMVYPGTANDTVVYTITYRNIGATALNNVTITDPAPAGFYYTNHTNSGPFTGSPVEPSGDGYGNDNGVCETAEPCIITWSAATLAAGASGSLTLTLKVVNPYTGSPYANNVATMASTDAPTVSDDALVGIYNSSGICDAFFFHNETENVGYDGVRYTSSTVSPVPADTGTGVLITAPSRPAWIEAIRFYNPPSADDLPISDTIESRMYIDRNAGSGITLRGTVYDYDPVTGARTSLGQGQRTFLGNQTGLHTFSISRSGTLLAGHRLLWVYEAQTDHASKTEQLLFQFDGTVPNTVSDTNPPISTTFANSHALLCTSKPSLIIKKVVDKTTAVSGDNLRYTITVSNLGTANATGSNVVDILPEGVTLITALSDPNRPGLNGTSLTLGTDYTCSGQTCTFPVRSAGQASGVIAAGATATLILNATVNTPLPPGINQLVNYATADSNETSPVSDAVSTSVGLPTTPYVTLIKSADKTRLIPGETVTYSILVINTGLGAASNIVVTDNIPQTAYFSYVSGSIAGGNSRTVTGTPVSQLQWTINSLASGGTATLTFQMLVASSGVPAGITERSNFVSATEATTTPANSNTVIVSISSNANLQITKTASPSGSLSTGGTVQYTITVSSIGASTAAGVLVTDPIPSGTSYVPGTLIYQGSSQTDKDDYTDNPADISHYEGAANRTVFRIGDLAAGQSRTMKLSVTADPTFPNGTTTVTNTATASASNTASKNGTASLSVAASPQLYISKAAPDVLPYPLTTLAVASGGTNQITVANSIYMQVNDVIVLNAVAYQITAISGNVITLDKVVPGGLGIGAQVLPAIKYVFSYGNRGNADATGVVVRETLMAGLSYISAYSSANCPAGTPINCSVGTLAAGQSGSITIRALPASAGTYTNYGAVLSNEVDTFNSNTVTTRIGGLLVSKSTSTAAVINNPADGTPETGTYTITLTPQVSMAGVTFKVTDYLPVGFTFRGGSSAFANGTCTGLPTAGSRTAVWTGCSFTVPTSVMTITFNVDIGTSVSAGTYQNPALVEVTSATTSAIMPFDELNTTAEDITVTIPGDVSVSKAIVSGPFSCAQGTCVDYRITARNLGTAAATNITIKDTDTDGSTYPPTNLAYVSSTPSTGTYDSTLPLPIGEWSIPGPLASGASATLDIRFSITSFTTTINNCATRTASNPPDSNPGNDRYCVALIPTRVTLSSFDAYEEGGKTVVEWSTSSERDTVGFYLLRKRGQDGDYVRVNRQLLPSLITSHNGGTYRLVDKGTRPGDRVSYLLVEVETRGSTLEYGPFVFDIGGTANQPPYGGSDVTVSQRLTRGMLSGSGDGGIVTRSSVSRQTAPDGTLIVNIGSSCSRSATYSDDSVEGYTRTARGTDPASSERRRAAEDAIRKVNTLRKSFRANTAKIGITEPGMYYVDAASISGVLGIPVNQAMQFIKTANIRLTNKGREVAYMQAAGNAGLFFYGEAIDSIYTKENVYWLTTGRGAIMPVLPAGKKTPESGYSVFQDTVHLEEDLYFLANDFMDLGSDYWIWDLFFGGYPGYDARTYTIDAPGAAASGGRATLRVALQGFSNTDASPDHHLKISVNGTEVGEAFWDGTDPKTAVVTFGQDLLFDGPNSIELRAMLDTGAFYSVFFLNEIDLTYWRMTGAENNSIRYTSTAQGPVTVYGFTRPDIFVFNLSDPTRPSVVSGASVAGHADGTYSVSFTSGAGIPYLAVTSDAMSGRTEPVADRPSDLHNKKNAADYLLIAPSVLAESARALADYRQKQGLSAMVVDVEDIMDEFNYGISSPEAIRGFIRHAYYNWAKPPKYLLLAGEGTYDYKNNMGIGDNLMPVYLADTPMGFFPSDNLYADVDGDNLPDIAIGRLPALTPAELDSMIRKIIAYETTPGSRIIMLSDNADDGGDFPADSREIARLIPSKYSVERISLAEYPVDIARSALIQALNRDSVVLANYIGHSGYDRFAAEGLLTSNDLPLLTNGLKPPVVTAMTCYVGQFGLPGYDTMSELLVLKDNGGAVAVMSPTGLSLNSLARELNKDLFAAAFSGKQRTMGDVVLNAMRAYAGNGGATFMVHIYGLLGDPALRVW